MEKQLNNHWNQLVYYVSNVYSATSKFKPGEPSMLGEKIRRSAISLTAGVNILNENHNQDAGFDKIYPVLSTVSVLETYLQLAKDYNILNDTSLLDEKLNMLKRVLEGLMRERE